MNRQKAKELLPILIAFTEGKPIQKCLIVNNQWVDAGEDIEFSCNSDRYRVKPDPRVIYRVEKVNSSMDFWSQRYSRESAEISLADAKRQTGGNYHIVEYIEKV